MTDELKVPNPCIGCHTDKNNAWARDVLLKWPDVSPWRIP